ncbi:MAG: hypothetical protein ACTSYB_01695 [Candidatus Helarchaeota archaeon]
MGKVNSQITDDGSKKLLKLTNLMSNYLTLLSPPEKLQADLQQFFKERSKYEEIITEQNLAIQDLQNQLQKMSKLSQENQQLKAQLTELQQKMSSLERTLNSLSESQSLKDLNIKLQSDLKVKTEKLENLTQELSNLQLQYDELSKKTSSISEITAEIERLKNKLAGEWKTNQQLRQTLQKERETIKTLQSEKKGLEYALRRLERRLTAKRALRGLSIPVHQIEISEGAVEDAELQEQIKNMNLELQKRLDRIKELEMRNKELKERLAKSSTRDLQLEVQRLKADLEAKNGAIMGLESTRKKLMEQIESHQQRIAELQNKIMAQGKEIEEKNKMIQSLEAAVSSGVHDQQAREVIENLQQQNRDLRNEVRESEKIIRSLEKNIKFLQTEMKHQKDQAYKLYNQTKDQAVLIQKLESALRKGGSVAGIDLQALESAKQASRFLGDEGPSLDDEIKERDRKIKRLESYVESLKQEVEDLQFRITSRDVKIDELNNILKELKASIASSKAKIIIRPPSTDEFRKTKVKL